MDGDGTKLHPYLVRNQADLNAIRNDNDKHYRLMADIDLVGNWTCFDFFGYFDGNGHKISGLNAFYDGVIPAYGFICKLYGTIKNVSLIYNPSSINEPAIYFGGCCGHALLGSRLVNVIVRIDLSSETDRAGGVVGYSPGQLSLKNCMAFTKITSGARCGNVVGYTGGHAADLFYPGVYSDEGGVNNICGGDAGDAYSVLRDAIVDVSVLDHSNPSNYPGYFDWINDWRIDSDGYPIPRRSAASSGEGYEAFSLSGSVQKEIDGANSAVARPVVGLSRDGLTGEFVVVGSALSDGITGSFTLAGQRPPDADVYLLSIDGEAALFTASAAVDVGDLIRPTAANGHVYEVTIAGDLPATEPAWWDTGDVQIGTATLRARQYAQAVADGPLQP